MTNLSLGSIVIKKVSDAQDRILYIFYEHGKLNKPFLILDQYEIAKLE